MTLEFVLLDGSDHRFLLEEGQEVTVGTSQQCTLRLAAVDVSRTHALITCQHGKVRLLDLGSTNGTFVNGRRIKEAELEPGDVVRFSSIIAQVMPEAVPSPAGGSPVGRETSGQVKSSSELELFSGTLPILLQDSMLWLFRRWALPEASASVALVEWMVAQRGMRGAAIAEEANGETILRASHGEVRALLDDQRFGALVRDAIRRGGTLVSVQLELGKRDVIAVHGPPLPVVLLLLPGTARPEATELELYVLLLRIAQRLDAPGARSA